MAVRFRKDRNKWLAAVDTTTGRISRSFDTEAEATEWEAKAKVGAVEEKERDEWIRNTSPEGSLGQLVDICTVVDWEGKDLSQMENARRLAKMLGPRTHPATMTMEALDDLVVDLRQSGLSNSTILKYLSSMKVMLKRACRLKLIPAVPLFPEGRTLKRPEPRDLVIPDEWLLQLLDRLEQREHRLAVALTLFLRHMGCRVGEAISLTWDRVDMRGKRVQFVKTKGAMPRRLPMPPEVVPLLVAMKARGTELVFPIGYMTYLRQYSDAKHAACDALGLGPDVRKEWVIHTLRHTRITELARLGWQAPAIQKWAGHKSLAVTQRYIHAAGIDLEALVKS
jgi:integrase